MTAPEQSAGTAAPGRSGGVRAPERFAGTAPAAQHPGTAAARHPGGAESTQDTGGTGDAPDTGVAVSARDTRGAAHTPDTGVTASAQDTGGVAHTPDTGVTASAQDAGGPEDAGDAGGVRRGTGRYRSPRRDDAAAATRAAILDAGRALFLTHGYAAVTVPQIAAAARVAPQTVYTSAGGKAGVLAALLQPLLDDTGAASANAAARATSDPREVIALAAAGTRRIHETHRELLHRLIRQAPGEPAAQLAIDDAVAKCLRGLAEIAARLQALPGLRPGLRDARLVDSLYFFFGPDSWYTLIAVRGWAFDEAEAWLTDAARRTLLD